MNGEVGEHGDNWINPEVASAFYNSIQGFRSSITGANITLHYGDISAYDPSINLGHQTHTQGRAIDLHYIGEDGVELHGRMRIIMLM